MRLKTLLLGSAAAFAFAAGSAQAADLSVAEPVDYVRVCDAFGAGYWYIPGTDTCIAISGKVAFKMGFGDDDPYDSGDHTGNWAFETGGDLNIDVRSMTDWGPLVGFIALESSIGWAISDPNGKVFMGEAYISLGPLLMGYTGSVFNGGAGFTDSGIDLADSDANQVQLSWAFNGFGIALGIQDPAEAFGSSAEDMPVIALALTTEMAGWDASLSFFYGPNSDDDVFAVLGDIATEVGMFGFSLSGLWVEGTASGLNNGIGSFLEGSGWAVNASSVQNWQSNFYTAETIAFADSDQTGSNWGFEAEVGWSPADTIWFRANAITVNEGNSWNYLLFVEKEFGPNP